MCLTGSQEKRNDLQEQKHKTSINFNISFDIVL